MNGGGSGMPGESGEFPIAMAGLETAVLDACAVEGEWPAQVAAGIYAGVDFAIENPTVARALTIDAAAEADSMHRYERVIGRLAGFIQVKATNTGGTGALVGVDVILGPPRFLA